MKIQVEKKALMKAGLEDQVKVVALEMELGKANKDLEKAKLKLV